MQLVDAHRRLEGLARGALLQPGLVLPLIIQWPGDDRCGSRRMLGGECDGISLQRQDAVGAENLVLVGIAGLQARNEQLPYARRKAQPHRVSASVPAIEAADYRDAPRIGCPYGETHTLHAVDLDHLGAEHPADLPMVALGEQMHVQLAQLRTEAVRVFGDLLTTGPADAQQVGLLVSQTGDEEAGHLALLHHRQQLLVAVQHFRAQCVGQVGAHHHCFAIGVRPKNGERVAMLGSHQSIYIGVTRHQGFPWHGQGRAISHWNLHRKAVVPGPSAPVAGRATRSDGSPLRKRSRTRISPG